MKKKLLGSLLSVALIAVLAMSVAACGKSNTKTAMAYGTIDNGYFVAASVTIENKKIVDADIEEVMMPQYWGGYMVFKQENDAVPVAKEHYKLYAAKYGAQYYFVADYVKIDNKYYASTVADGKITYTPCDDKGVSTGTDDLVAKLGSDRDTQEWYYNTAINKPASFELMKKEGDKLVSLGSGLVAYNGLLKSSNNYWPGDMQDGIKQWQRNVNITVDYVIANGIPSESAVNDNKELGKKPEDLITGATWDAYDSYLAVLREAFALASK